LAESSVGPLLVLADRTAYRRASEHEAWFSLAGDACHLVDPPRSGEARGSENSDADGLAGVAASIQALGIGAVHLYGYPSRARLALDVAFSFPALVRSVTVADGLRHIPTLSERRARRLSSAWLSVPVLTFERLQARSAVDRRYERVLPSVRSLELVYLTGSLARLHIEQRERLLSGMRRLHSSRALFEHLLDFAGAI
jgi:hypothetical protein